MERLVFESIDEQPFKVVNVQPAVAMGTLPAEAKKKHELAIDWDKFLDQAKNTRVTFYFDHPKCTQHFTIVKVDAEQRKILRENANQGRNASTPSTKGDKQSVLTTSGQATTPTRTTPRVDSLSNLTRRGKVQDLEKRLAGGENPNEVDTSGVPLLAIAAKEGNVTVMEVLLGPWCGRQSDRSRWADGTHASRDIQECRSSPSADRSGCRCQHA